MKAVRAVSAAAGVSAIALLFAAAVRPALEARPVREVPRVEYETKVIVARAGDAAYRALEDDGWTMCLALGRVSDDGSPAQYLFKRGKVSR
jgi:hypothetical protein